MIPVKAAEDWYFYLDTMDRFNHTIGHRCKPKDKFFTLTNISIQKTPHCWDCKVVVPNEVIFMIELYGK